MDGLDTVCFGDAADIGLASDACGLTSGAFEENVSERARRGFDTLPLTVLLPAILVGLIPFVRPIVAALFDGDGDRGGIVL